MSAFDHTFRAAIPGSSLTHKLGDLPHEKPPKFTDPDEACNFIWKQLHNKNMLKQLWQLLENGANVRSITLAVLYKMALEGVIQMNLGIIISPTVAQMVTTLGKAKGIKGIKVMPKFKDPVKDVSTNQDINTRLGRHKHLSIPPSALQAMAIPKAEDLTSDTNKFMNKPMPKDGVLSMAQGTK